VFDNENPIRVVGISGSLRTLSYNTACLLAAGELMPEDMALEIAEISEIPMYNGDDEKARGFPDSVLRLRSRVADADALLIASPEYNFSITGALKNTWDWLSRPPDPPINLLPAAILGVGGRLGTARSQHHFRDIARHNDLRMVQKPEVLISTPWEKFDEDLRLTDARTLDQISRLVLALRSLTMRIKATRRRMLVVGRKSSDLNRITTQLNETGYEVVAVLDDESAFNLIDPGQFSAVIIDKDVESESFASLSDYTSHIAPNTMVIEDPSNDQLHHLLEERKGPK